MNNLEQYKNDLEKLIHAGEKLFFAMLYKYNPERFRNAFKDKTSEFFDNLPDFYDGYEAWYSEAKELIRQLLPDRLDDFVGHYENQRHARI